MPLNLAAQNSGSWGQRVQQFSMKNMKTDAFCLPAASEKHSRDTFFTIHHTNKKKEYCVSHAMCQYFLLNLLDLFYICETKMCEKRK